MQGLGKIVEWAQSIRRPAITGTVIDKALNRPSNGYFEAYGRSNEDFDFWMRQMTAAKTFDWQSAISRDTTFERSGPAYPIEITWSEGVVEKIDLQEISVAGAWITTTEEWQTNAPT